MGDDHVIDETRAKLQQRLDELQPAVEEAAKIEAALKALNGGGGYPRPPVTSLDTLKPVDE
jgi:hypothetical protein